MVKEGTYITIQSWMRNELDLSGTELLVYAIIYGFSQDGETRYSGSRQYLADWCGCSVRSVQTALNNLTDRGLITKYESFRNNVKLCEYVTNFTTSEKISPPSEKSALNKIDNTIDNNKSFSKEKDEVSEYDSHMYSPEELKNDFLGSSRKRKSTRPKSQSLYSKCIAEINLFTQDLQLHTLLVKYLNLRLEMKDKPLYYNQWKGMLSKLADIIKDNAGMSYEDVVRQSIEKGYASFYPVNSYSKGKNVFAEGNGLSCEQSEETEEERKESLRRSGRRSEF